ncbi:MAG: MarR family winged helix-turn-helix transcriptional regulator [Tabrizicola sp.]|jgi:DNA-binding MarR family transcriptional regulator|nr:MarR family winged helix-turn-helix transcriptional regulator [Tabrizicola sp.]
MATGGTFDLQDFLPYLLNQAAEATSRGFQATYRDQYGLTRTQWRVMANLGRFGAMTARDICRISHIDKTKVSRAVAGMEAEGLLTRATSDRDRRAENLSLTPKGRAVFAEIGQRALAFDADLRARLGPEVAARIDAILREIIALQSDAPDAED